MNNTALIMLIVYMVVTLGISAYFARKEKEGTEGFMVAKGNLGVGLIIPLLFSELIAGAGTIGNAAKGFSVGVSSAWASWGMALGCILLVLFTCRFFRVVHKKEGIISVPEAYQYLFDGRSRTVLLVIIVVVYGILYSMQPTAAAAIIGPLIGVDQVVVAWCITGIFVLVTIAGGMKGIAWMNIIHALIMYFGIFIISTKSVGLVGGLSYMKSALPDTYFSFVQPNVVTTVANAAGTALSFLVAATAVSVVFGAKNTRTAKTGITIGACLIIPFGLAVSLVGVCAKVIMPDIESNSALFLMANHLGDVFGGLAAMAIIAAIWSTGPALLLIVSTTITKDFYKRVKPEATDKQQLLFSKIAIVVIAVVATALGFGADSILDQMYGAFQIRSIAGIVLVVALFWPRVTKDAAFWSMLVGGILAAVWYFAGNPFGVAALWPSSAVCLIILIIMTMRSKEKVSEGYRKYKEALETVED